MGKASRKKRQQDLQPESILNGKSLIASGISSKWSLFNKPIVHFFLIAIGGFFVYSNTFNVPFHFDDTFTIVKNPGLKDLSNFWPPSGSRWFGFLTFALNYYFGGLNVTGYHIVNLTIHIFNAILVYWLVVLTFKTPFFSNQQSAISSQQSKETNFDSPIHPFSSASGGQAYLPLFIALLFVSHPIQTQAVTYIVQRFTSLATMFYLLSLACYIRSRLSTLPATRYTLYTVSLVSAILSMKTKEISFTLPIVITLYEFMFFGNNQFVIPVKTGIQDKNEMDSCFRRNDRMESVYKRLLFLIPFLLTMLIIPLSMIGTDKPIGDAIGELREASQETKQISRGIYLFIQFRVIVTYIRLLFIPINQNLDYDYSLYHSFFNPEVFLSALFLLSIFILGIYLLCAKRLALPASRLISFGIFWFFITLSVESSIIPIRDVIFEHRLYLPSIGIIIIFVSLTFYIFQAMIQNPKRSLAACCLLLATAVIVFSIATYQRNIVWKDWVTLWEDVIQKSPRKGRAFNALGWYYLDKKDYSKAIGSFWEAINRHPFYADLYLDLAEAYHGSRDIDKEIWAYRRAMSLGKDGAKIHIALADALFIKGEWPDAKEEFEKALVITPSDAYVHFRVGLIYRAYSNYEASIDYLKKAISIEPNSAAYHAQLGEVYLLAGQIEKAISELSISLQLNPNDIVGMELLRQAKQKIHTHN